MTDQQPRSFENTREYAPALKGGIAKRKIYERTTSEIVTTKTTTTYAPRSHRDSGGYAKESIQTTSDIPLSRENDIRLYTRYEPPTVERNTSMTTEFPVDETESLAVEKRTEKDGRLLKPKARREEYYKEETIYSSRIDKTTTPVGITTTHPKNGAREQPIRINASREEVRKPRVIDYATYIKEVEQLQKKAEEIHQSTHTEFQHPIPLRPAVVLSPVQGSATHIVSRQGYATEPVYKYFSKSEFEEKEIVEKLPFNETEATPSSSILQTYSISLPVAQNAEKISSINKGSQTIEATPIEEAKDKTDVSIISESILPIETGTQKQLTKGPDPTLRSEVDVDVEGSKLAETSSTDKPVRGGSKYTISDQSELRKHSENIELVDTEHSLLETLSKELKYEEAINIEMQQRKRVVKDSSVQLEVTEEASRTEEEKIDGTARLKQELIKSHNIPIEHSELGKRSEENRHEKEVSIK